MASTRKRTTKDGKVFYEISVSRGRGKSRLTRRWYPPEGWSKKSIERELAAVAAGFERQSDAGEVISRAEHREKDAQDRAEAAKILTLRQYGERVFMPSKTVTMSENSRANYQGYLDRTIYPALGDIRLPEITPAQISALLLDVQAGGKAHSTVMKVYTILHSFFKMVFLEDMIDRNPMDKVERPKPRKDEVKADGPLAYSPSEVQKIISGLEQEPLKWQALVHLLIDTGIRRGECCALQWKNIDFATGAITITNGADVASVSEALGHSDKAVTLRMYTHADQESISQAAQIVRDAIKKAGQR